MYTTRGESSTLARTRLGFVADREPRVARGRSKSPRRARSAAVYDEPGVVSLALAPNSRIEVVANDLGTTEHTGGVTVALSRGSLHADVTPRTEGEVFAVEVERTRIAVHGTSFTVSREGDRVIVDVAHGSVAVGPVGHPGATHGWLVVGPDRASFLARRRARKPLALVLLRRTVAPVEPTVEPPSAVVADAPASRAKRSVAANPYRGSTCAARARARAKLRRRTVRCPRQRLGRRRDGRRT